ncbi:MAG: thiamine-phosphate kinase [Aphanocapsa feldmannii 277cV]|uniref:Thiamine-monophosphate kinase n=2 Tax=Aphanocapsa feldmannii TaxID=192050 RepID=A0A524RP59_9CHRO|nr:MAG: thiamine-phosphate kinase [Aphanocapsa feldmannii 277cV]TGH21560.1 MAG: thiamine-phosphate kinase [Aphanocapsa feldmannii 277cI]
MGSEPTPELLAQATTTAAAEDRACAAAVEPGDPCLAELGEAGLIERLAGFAPPGQFGNDAALVQPGPDEVLVVSTDVLVENNHFSDTTTPPFSVGWRAAAANLSDLAAMGCTRVHGLTIALQAPGTTPWGWVEQAYRGLAKALEPWGGIILGGDCAGAAQRSLAITALGGVVAQRLIRREGARAGDWLVATGPHGLSGLGLALLLGRGDGSGPLDPGLRQRAIDAHRYPRPRLDVPLLLQRSQPAETPWQVAGTDSSDGLGRALELICDAAGLGARLDQPLPLPPGLASLEEGKRWCLWGGEDFELVLALCPAWARALLAADCRCRLLGRLVSEPGLLMLEADGSHTPIRELGAPHRHFESS